MHTWLRRPRLSRPPIGRTTGVGLPRDRGLDSHSGVRPIPAYFRRVDEPFPIGRLIFWAVAFRLCGLVGGPFFEDDFYRYLWDGYLFATAGTPYGAAPEDFFIDQTVPLALQAVLDEINHPELPTIYGPTTQFVFLLGYWLHPGGIATLQSLLIAVDLATLALLLRLAPARNVLLYAWCPLVIKEVAFTAHPDGLGVCLLLAAIVLGQRQHWRSAAMCLGLAVGAKVFALVLVPLVLVRAKLRHWVWFAGTLALLYAPFVVTGETELDSLLVFAREWEFNAAVFGLLTVALPATPRNSSSLQPVVRFGFGTIGAILRVLPTYRAAIGYTGHCWPWHRSSTRGTCSGCYRSQSYSQVHGHGRPPSLCSRAPTSPD